ncbi:MAG: hypothetical protein LWW78_00265 [Deltaproteobacteria bacterium]|nr:hypothetical protein [Deltaproteobacteria bacterium]
MVKTIDLDQILSQREAIEKIQKTRQRFGKEAKRVFFLELQEETVRQEKRLLYSLDNKGGKLKGKKGRQKSIEKKGEREKHVDITA